MAELALDAVAIAAVTVAGVAYLKERSRVADLARAGFCPVCSGSGREQCTLCYGRGSIAKPGYVNVADRANRASCKRCDGSGTFVCRTCGGGGQRRREGTVREAPKRQSRRPSRDLYLPASGTRGAVSAKRRSMAARPPTSNPRPPLEERWDDEDWE